MGWIVTDADGLPLYRYDKDMPKPAKSNCEGECAKAWKPVLADKTRWRQAWTPVSIGS